MKHSDEILWYAVHTKPRAEKKVEDRLIEKGFETYLPTHKVVRQWSDRRKKIEVPLINSYVFVQTTDESVYDVADTDGVARILYHQGKPAKIRQSEIDAMREFLVLSEGYSVCIERDIEVEITEGPLKGACGKVERIGKDKLRLRIEQLRLVIHAEIDRSSVKPLKKV